MTTQRAKLSTSERALKTELKTGVGLFVAFCLIKFVAWQVVFYDMCKECLLYQQTVSPIPQKLHSPKSSMSSTTPQNYSFNAPYYIHSKLHRIYYFLCIKPTKSLIDFQAKKASWAKWLFRGFCDRILTWNWKLTEMEDKDL